ncbi:EAL domain-containing protein [Afifella sp. IM 167]|uniref:sensor domain-containing phosphodiesterase n=1 Tax=Afifella sp. IM 167 TaxID=2033586 RepID=UPI001CCD677C|nr:EAL domain-containing protein [Afifella sp. IM 167]
MKKTEGQIEAERMRALRELNLIDTAPSESFDRITRMASRLFGAPISAVSLTDVDRQWFKSRVGCGTEIPRDKAPCAEVTRSSDFLFVRDLAADPRFAGGILPESGVRFYAGAPLTTKEGYTLGSMCVLDTEPRDFSEEEARSLVDLAAMVMAQIELQHALGRLEPSSGLPNRAQFSEDIEDLARDHPGEARTAVMFDLADAADLAQAMRVLGPAYLDELTRVASGALRPMRDEGHDIYHVSTTQFAAIFPEEEEKRLRERLTTHLGALAEAARHSGLSATPGIAVGLAPFRLGETSAGAVLRSAHHAAQDAREADAAFGLYSATTDEAHQRRYALLEGLRAALREEGQFSLVYQPRIELASGTCTGAEALLRWNHPELGAVSPGEFIPLAEQSDLARPLTDWVLDAALSQMRGWRHAGLAVRVSVNVSAANLEEEDFGLRLAAALARHSVSPSWLEIEFTESALIRHRARVIANLAEIRALGIACAIDDFGTGYSSFSYLQDFPADTIKIDQAFIRTLVPGSRGSVLVASIVAMARDLGYRVVAEGVETQEVCDFLASCDCDEAQGYLFSRPVPPQDFVRWLAAGGEAERRIA